MALPGNKKIKNVSLIGFMGAGKSTVGKILAGQLNFLFLDLDNIIELEQDLKIAEIFKKFGEKYFREIESEVIRKIYINSGCVFACGGGVVLKKYNMEIIKKNSIVVYLSIKPGQALKRLSDVRDRPLLPLNNRKKVIETLMGERDYLYRQYSDLVVEVNSKEPITISKEITGDLENENY